MTNKIEKILSELNETELAFFAKYKKNTYSASTRNIIENWLNAKNLTKEKIESIVQINEFKITTEKNKCSRCNSDKFINEQMQIHEHSDVAFFDGDAFRQDLEKIDLKVCFVCGFRPYIDNKPNFLKKFFKKFFN
jgi:DNA-directed RNA polymerase subunit M/transcription elongation factor TFIIS